MHRKKNFSRSKTLITIGLIYFFIVLGCKNAPEMTENTNLQYKNDILNKKLDLGLKALEEENYNRAKDIFSKILVQSPATELDFVILFNLASSYEGLKDCNKATEVYRQIVNGALAKFERLTAYSLLRLSYTYECLGQDQKALAALLDVSKKSTLLQEDMQKTDLPSRLASAYVKVGNPTEAKKYFLQALNGVKFLQNKYKESKVLSDTLARTLYFMGKSNIPLNEFKKNPTVQLENIRYLQLYLLQAVELNNRQWSPKASQEILHNYHQLWSVLSEKVDSQSYRLDTLKSALQTVRQLRMQRIPNRNESHLIKSLFENLEEEENKITLALSSQQPLIDLTPQEKNRQSIKQSGKVVAQKESILEKKAQRKKIAPIQNPK
ncbi:MAG: hypothetical protein K1X29_04290 [Bdellovibrionales bacterium]|nr:hypothetical protein [Bdellovibrionales bacterium]